MTGRDVHTHIQPTKPEKTIHVDKHQNKEMGKIKEIVGI